MSFGFIRLNMGSIFLTTCTLSVQPRNSNNSFQVKTCKTPSSELRLFFQKSLPLAASALILLSPCPGKAGFLSGSPGLESVPGPQLPQIDFLSRFNEENQKKYAETDAKFKESPVLKELLERSKLNKQKNQQKIQDKYCLRGAEWGVGDCTADGMSAEDRDNFISMLRKKVGPDQ